MFSPWEGLIVLLMPSHQIASFLSRHNGLERHQCLGRRGQLQLSVSADGASDSQAPRQSLSIDFPCQKSQGSLGLCWPWAFCGLSASPTRPGGNFGQCKVLEEAFICRGVARGVGGGWGGWVAGKQSVFVKMAEVQSVNPLQVKSVCPESQSDPPSTGKLREHLPVCGLLHDCRCGQTF